MRSAGKFKLWSPGYKNKPFVSPPGSLKIVFVLCVLSVVGTLLFAISQSLTLGGNPADFPANAIFVGFLNLVLPLVIAYTINANHPSSRILILGYVTTVYVWALLTGRLTAILSQGPYISAWLLTILYLLVLLWLFRSAKMRYYYALISGRSVPNDLTGDADRLAGDAWLSDKARRRMQWVADHLETVVLIGFIVLAIGSFVLTSLRFS